MATNHHESNEGVVIAWGILLMLLCFGGASVTGTSFMEFFFVMLFIFLNILVFLAIGIGIFCIFVYAFKRDKEDTRTFLQVFKEEYNHNKLLDHYTLLWRYLGEYLSETESYAYVMRHLGAVERLAIRFLRHPIKTIKGETLDEDIEETEKAAVPLVKTKTDEGIAETEFTDIV